jgi:hypothetical protein
MCARCWWLTAEILATQDAETRIMVWSQPEETETQHKKGAGGVAQDVGPEFKPQ